MATNGDGGTQNAVIAARMRSRNSRVPSVNSNRRREDYPRSNRRPVRTPSKRRPSTRRGLSEKATSSKLRKRLTFGGSTSSEGEESAFKLKCKRIDDTLDLIYKDLGKVDKMESKFTAEKGQGLTASDADVEESGDTQPEDGDGFQSEEEFSSTKTVTVYSGNTTDEGSFHAMEEGETFEQIYREYAAKIDAKPEQIKLMYDSRVVPPHATPWSADIPNGALIQVVGVDRTMNTDPGLRKITIVQTVSTGIPIELTLVKLPSYTIQELYNEWAEYVGYDYRSFYLLCDQTNLPTTGTLEYWGVKNGSKLFSAFYRNRMIGGRLGGFDQNAHSF